MAKIITDMETWLTDYSDRIYRYLVYKKMFTPYEEREAFSDESVYESNHYQLCQIEEAIDIGNGDWLLGLRNIDDDGQVFGQMVYLRLSEIRLEFFDRDQTLELYEGEEK